MTEIQQKEEVNIEKWEEEEEEGEDITWSTPQDIFKILICGGRLTPAGEWDGERLSKGGQGLILKGRGDGRVWRGGGERREGREGGRGRACGFVGCLRKPTKDSKSGLSHLTWRDTGYMNLP